MNVKAIILIALVTSFAVGLVGCGGPQPEEAPSVGGGSAKGRLSTDQGAEAGAGKAAEGTQAQTDSPN